MHTTQYAAPAVQCRVDGQYFRSYPTWADAVWFRDVFQDHTHIPLDCVAGLLAWG